jgi:hypothetical protein
MAVAPSSFTVTGSGFTPGGTVAIQVLNSGGGVVAVSNASADSNGNLNVSVPSSQVLSVGINSAGIYPGSIVAVDTATGGATAPTPITLFINGTPNPPFYMGTGLIESASPYTSTQVFGASLNTPNANNWTSMAKITGPTTTFDLTNIGPNHEVVVALYTVTNQSATTVTFSWFRNRDNALLYTTTPSIPAGTWGYAYSYIGYDAWELIENGEYYVMINNNSTGENTTIRFAVAGLFNISSLDILGLLGIGDIPPSGTSTYPASNYWQGAAMYHFAGANFTTPYLTAEIQMDNWNWVLYQTVRTDKGVSRPPSPAIQALTTSQCAQITAMV